MPQTDASNVGWGACCQGRSTRGVWSLTEQEKYINILDLESCETGNIDIYNNRDISHHKFTDKQHDSSILLIKDWEAPKTEN